MLRRDAPRKNDARGCPHKLVRTSEVLASGTPVGVALWGTRELATVTVRARAAESARLIALQAPLLCSLFSPSISDRYCFSRRKRGRLTSIGSSCISPVDLFPPAVHRCLPASQDFAPYAAASSTAMAQMREGYHLAARLELFHSAYNWFPLAAFSFPVPPLLVRVPAKRLIPTALRARGFPGRRKNTSSSYASVWTFALHE